MSKIYFDLPHLYYLPQYISSIRELTQQSVECVVVAYDGADLDRKLKACSDANIRTEVVKDDKEAACLYNEEKPDWVIFGNDFSETGRLDTKIKTGLLYHGLETSMKRASLSPGLGEFDVRFISGPGRVKILEDLFPNILLVEAGFAKLDPLFNKDTHYAEQLDLAELGLDPNKKTILYCPTFYPSSIENMSEDFPSHFSEYNILIKCHDFTVSKEKYAHQLKKLRSWENAPNVYFAPPEEYSLIPFMGTADLMITDTSSAIFEFAALKKPVVICDFIKVRWSYRGPFRYRLRKRLDPSTQKYLQVAATAKTYGDLRTLVKQHIENPELLEPTRAKYSKEIMGNMDGKAAVRISEYLLSRIEPRH